MSASIKDVASLAGVSIATVSRVVNRADYPVSDEIRKRVERAIGELNYIPNMSAQSLRTQTNNGIALIVRNISNSYFSEITESVTETSLKKDCLAMVFNSMQDTSYELKFYELILRHKFNGVMIGGSGYYGNSQENLQNILSKLQRHGVRTVALAPQGFETPSITLDNRKLGAMITYYLVERGHRDIAYIGGYAGHIADEMRLRGYRDILSQQGIAHNESYIFRQNFNWQGGYECCRQILAQRLPITGICCTNDNVASGAIHCLKEHGIAIPRDISIIGIGNFPNVIQGYPWLTSISLPFRTQGSMAVEFVLSQKKLDDVRVVLDGEIIERESVCSL